MGTSKSKLAEIILDHAPYIGRFGIELELHLIRVHDVALTYERYYVITLRREENCPKLINVFFLSKIAKKKLGSALFCYVGSGYRKHFFYFSGLKDICIY